MDSTEKPTRKRHRETVAHILDKWISANSESSCSCNSAVAGDDVGSKKRRRCTVLPKGAKKGFMKGKGGPENLGCKYKGVRQRKSGKWVSEIRQPDGGPKLWLGTFDTADAAAAAFDRAALAMYGARAQVNIPLEKEGSGDSSSPYVVTTTQLGNFSDATDHGCVVDVVNNNNNNNDDDDDTNDSLPAEFDDDPLAPIVTLEQEDYCWINNIVFAGQESTDSSFIALNSGDSSSALTTTTTPQYCFAPSSGSGNWAVSDLEFEANFLGPLEFDTFWQSPLLWPESTLEDRLTEIAPPAQYDFAQSLGNWVGSTDYYELISEDYALGFQTNALGSLYWGTLLPSASLEQQELTLENATTQDSGLQEGSSAPDDQNELNDWVDELTYTGDISFI